MKLRKLYNRRQWFALIMAFMLALTFGVATILSTPSVTYAYDEDDEDEAGRVQDEDDAMKREQQNNGAKRGIFKTNSDPGGIYGVGSDPYSTLTGGTGNSKTLGGGAKPAFYISWIIDILKSPGEMINEWILIPNGMTMDHIIFGRLNNSTPVNYFQFEIVKGNPYGIVGAYLYNVFRLIMFIILLCMFMASVTKGLVISNSVRAREDLKSAFSKVLLFALALYLMPYAFQIFNYIRDVLLYVIRNVGSSILDISTSETKINGGSSLKSLFESTIPSSYRDSFNNMSGGLNVIFASIAKTSILGALVFDGFMVLSLYFAYSYVGVALAMTLYFVMFPFVCIVSYYDKSIASTWRKSVLSTLLVPVIDGTLLLIPATMFKVLLDKNWVLASILTFMICAMLIPSRKVIGRVLGLDMGGISALAGSAMAMMAVGRGIAGIGKAVHSAKAHHDNAKAAKDQAGMYDELAQAEEDVYGAGMENDEPMEDISVGAESGGVGGSFGGAGMGMASGVGMDHSLANAAMESDIATRGVDIATHQGEFDKAKRIYNDPNASEESREQARKDMGFHEESMDSLRVNDAEARQSIAQNRETDMAKQQELAMRQQKIMERHANVGMINTPQFNNLSNATKAKLLRQQARQENRKAIGSAVGATYGAVVGMGAGMFMGAPAQAMMMSAGANMGASVGRTVSNSAPVAATSSLVRRGASSVYNSDGPIGAMSRMTSYNIAGMREGINDLRNANNNAIDRNMSSARAKINSLNNK